MALREGEMRLRDYEARFLKGTTASEYTVE